jgi:cobalt-zinc-cadmium resistance protein CzcA
MVENILHRLSGTTTRRERRERAVSAAVEVARPIAFATCIVIVVFLPLFGMTGIEGRMYQPLAAAVIAAMIAALALALTLVPIAAAGSCIPHDRTDEDVLPVGQQRTIARPLPSHQARGAGALVPCRPSPRFRIGSGFMPRLDEGVPAADCASAERH